MQKVIFLSFLIVATVIGGLAFGGGSQEPSASESTGASSSTGPEPLTLPIVQQPMELTTFVTFDPTKAGGALTNYSEMACYKEMAKLTNITMKFVHPPVGQETEQFNLMISSGQFPDIIEWGWLNYPGGPEKAISDGAIIPLNDVIDKYAPNLKKILEDNPEARRQVMTDTGTIYNFPFLRLSDSWRIIFGFQIRESWLKKSGLSMPQSMDDWEKMLVAFKRNDMNGNGDPNDEIPVSGRAGMRWCDDLFMWHGVSLFEGFPQWRWHADQGKLISDQVSDEMFEAIKDIRFLYQEGLMDPVFVVQTGEDWQKQIRANKIGHFMHLPIGVENFIPYAIDNPDMGVVYLPPVSIDGKPPRKIMHQKVTVPTLMINKVARDPERIMKWWDFYRSKEGLFFNSFGIPEVDWTRDSAGNVKILRPEMSAKL